MDKTALIEKLQEEERQYYAEVMTNRRVDDSFARPDDEELTAEEIAAIDAYWGRYNFAYPEIDYKSFRTFKNRCGRFDVRHCPGAVRTAIFSRFFLNPDYTVVFQNKGLMDYLYPDFQKPRTVYRRLNGWFFDEDFHPVTAEETAAGCCEHIRTVGPLIIKTSGMGGGRGVTFLHEKDADPEYVLKLLTEDYGTMGIVIQQVLEQSPFMAALNPTSVNTVRISTLLYKGKAIPVAALVRVGNVGSELDNWCAGGSLVGVDICTGRLNNWAMVNDRTRVTTLSSGLDLSAQKLTLPSFGLIKEQVSKAHYRMPYIKYISWDIALDRNDVPTFIECNHLGMIQIHEATTGPVFGELMDALCDEYLLEKFNIRFAAGDLICKEYHDRVEIEQYLGESDTVNIPERLRDKPVTRIEPKAFKGRHVTKVCASRSVIAHSQKAMETLA